MSLQSWLAEFMPHAADSEEAQRAPAAHANQKWEGLRPENLARHGVEKQDVWITDWCRPTPNHSRDVRALHCRQLWLHRGMHRMPAR